ncbi:MAG: hypothetical protein JEZ06_17475 [Anaerolineaceae bacterium]|nr:hypothetical protein [Anaerolineaceae bacterium]
MCVLFFALAGIPRAAAQSSSVDGCKNAAWTIVPDELCVLMKSMRRYPKHANSFLGNGIKFFKYLTDLLYFLILSICRPI